MRGLGLLQLGQVPTAPSGALVLPAGSARAPRRLSLRVQAAAEGKSTKGSAGSRPPRRRKGPPAPAPRQPAAAGGADAAWRVFGVSVPALEDPGKDEYGVHEELLAALARKLGLASPPPADAVTLVRKSFDARTNSRAGGGGGGGGKSWVYVVDVAEAALLGAGLKRGRLAERPGQMERVPPPAAAAADAAAASSSGRGSPAAAAAATVDPVIVVGSGPAGLFAALAAAEAGLPVVLLERGQPVEARGGDIGRLFVRRQLTPDSNLCYGEGGAGTWSDGKLTTRIGRNSDPVRTVLSTLVRFGAPQGILVSGKPHLGTDRLVRVLKAFRQHLLALGAEVRFGARVADLIVERGRVAGVTLADGTELRGSRVVLAVGHSAREVYSRLAARGAALSAKPFAVGFRIEHPQALIDGIQYGERDAGAEVLRGRGRFPVADYRLAAEVDLAMLAALREDPARELGAPGQAIVGGGADDGQQQAEPGVMSCYSFCMCPGGQIVPTATSEEELCINGMSFSRRNSQWANSALVVGVAPSDWAHLEDEHGPLAGMALQQQIEREAARLGGGGFTVPVQRVVDFMEGRPSAGELPSSSYRLGVRAADLHGLYPPHMTEAFRAALLRFERQLPGFATDPRGLLHAAETRTSAPVRIHRGPDDLQSPTLPGLFPCGEGAGYAGGIMSAAVDGLRVGSAIAAEAGAASALADLASYKVQQMY